ncbi:MAG: tRNA (adenosine(37)-N6)-dimethylallyltransferase MiaA [Gammaproteobacteria bacterium]
MSDVDAILLAGPTASGKTDLVLALAERAPIEIVSVDSSQVYRGFDIGSAKPDIATRSRVPHHLIDIREPCETYSAGEFVADAVAVIGEIRSRGRMPVLVGGTMLYFNALVHGIASLPVADPAIRRRLDERAQVLGWPALHAELAKVDLAAAARIHPNDPQRIQRALEVYEASGRTISDWQRDTVPAASLRFRRDALVPADRTVLHERIEQRFLKMMADGFLTEVEKLRARPDNDQCSTAMRAVGYRQLSAHLAGETDLDEAVRRGIAASRQLAKRQLTWIRADAGWQVLEPFDPEARERWVVEATFVCRAAGRGTSPMVDWSTRGEMQKN